MRGGPRHLGHSCPQSPPHPSHAKTATHWEGSRIHKGVQEQEKKGKVEERGLNSYH